MLKSIFEQNLKRPKGIFGQILSLKFKNNLQEYYELEKYLELSKGMKLFEIGYGPGYGIKHILENNDVSIDGIDFSRMMYRKAIQRTKKYSSRIKLRYGDFNEFIYNGNSYDRVFLLNVIYFWNDIQKSIGKIISLIKEKGIVIIGMASPELLSSVGIKNNKVFHQYEINDIVNILMKYENIVVSVKEHEKIKGCYYIIGKKR